MLKTFRRPAADYKWLFALMFPMIAQNIMTTTLALADTVMVGVLGQNELSGLTQANAVFFVLQLFVFGVQSGASVLIGQYWGKRDTSSISRIVGISLYVTIAIMTIAASVVFFFPKAVMSLTTNDPTLVAVAARYGRIVAPSLFLNSISLIFVGAQRNAENTKLGMYILTGSSLINIFLNWVLIFGKLGAPALGVEGAAYATLISRCIEFTAVMIYIIFIDKRLPLKLSDMLKPGKAMWADFVKYATPVLLNETIWSIGYSMYAVIFGYMQNASDILAAYSITGNIERLMMVVCFAVANSAAVIIGKEVGAGKSKEYVLGLGKWLLAISALSGAVSGGILLLIRAFALEPIIFKIFPLVPNAERIVHVMCIIMAVRAIFKSYNTTCIVGVLRGGGDVKTGMYLDILTMYMYALPVGAIAAFIFKADISVVFSLIISEDIIKMIIEIYKIRGGSWVRNLTRDF